MPSRIVEIGARLRARHYVCHATAANHWFDFMENRVNVYRSRYSDDFCLIINGSRSDNDAYIIPWAVARTTFTREALNEKCRWIGTIVGTRPHLSTDGANMNVVAYHNAFHLIGL